MSRCLQKDAPKSYQYNFHPSHRPGMLFLDSVCIDMIPSEQALPKKPGTPKKDCWQLAEHVLARNRSKRGKWCFSFVCCNVCLKFLFSCLAYRNSLKLHKDLDCYPQVWQDVATAYYVSSATSLRAKDAHVEQNPIARPASFGNPLEAQVELTRSAPRLPGPLSPQQRPPCFGMVAAKSWCTVRSVHQDFVQTGKIASGLCQ
jgi:hypothetical protein